MNSTSVLLADDSLFMLQHVSKMLHKDRRFRVVASVRDGSAVLDAYVRHKPDVVILDISMGDVSGIEVAQDLRHAGCRAKIIFLTVHEDSDFVNAAIGAGGSAYVVKSRLSTDLVVALRAVIANKMFVSSNLLPQHD